MASAIAAKPFSGMPASVDVNVATSLPTFWAVNAAYVANATDPTAVAPTVIAGALASTHTATGIRNANWPSGST